MLEMEWIDIPSGKVVIYNLNYNSYRRSRVGKFKVKPFRLAKYPVTWEQYQVFVEADDGYYEPHWWMEFTEHTKVPLGKEAQEARWPIERHPRTNVNWFEAMAYCKWLSHRLGYAIRLPTECEWQWAAQGPDKRNYPWGNLKEPRSERDEYYTLWKENTTPVGSHPKGASYFGVMDMVGNVTEWCINHWKKPNTLTYKEYDWRILKGSSWASNDDVLMHNIYRQHRITRERASTIGFRVCAPQ